MRIIIEGELSELKDLIEHKDKLLTLNASNLKIRQYQKGMGSQSPHLGVSYDTPILMIDTYTESNKVSIVQERSGDICW